MLVYGGWVIIAWFFDAWLHESLMYECLDLTNVLHFWEQIRARGISPEGKKQQNIEKPVKTNEKRQRQTQEQ